MSTLTIHLPDDKHARLRELARGRSMSINKPMEELATISIAEFDAETRFRTLATCGSAQVGIALLDKLDAAFPPKSKYCHARMLSPKNMQVANKVAFSYLVGTMPALVIKSFPEALHNKLRQFGRRPQAFRHAGDDLPTRGCDCNRGKGSICNTAYRLLAKAAPAPRV